ncbi:MAG: bifunctional folylpolyglutamate synthase/dihydrofolate synthase [Candidatus Omnitrophica bacterium]|nr:bifunctional folylpolyglutamate synthase/dihydrofolate synthase [Candidatus Omnitrophota bacterium]
MSTYKEIENYLDTFINYEKKIFFPYQKSLKLGRVRHLFQVLKIPYQELNVVHIAGTKGKGSVATFLAYLLAFSRYKIGLYTSPHFYNFRERIKVLEKINSQVKETLISKREVVTNVEKFKPYLESLRYSPQWGKLTFFEIYTALALYFFCQQNLDFTILEVGLGGRLDATNVVTPLVSVITHIGYDHTQKLGKRLKDIAYEKAGIIKEGIPVVSSWQRPAVLEVIKNRAKALNAPLYILGRDFNFSRVRVKSNYTLFDFWFNKTKIPNLKIALKGLHQVENASLALATLLLLLEKVKYPTIKEALSTTFLEGRFEIVKTQPLIILDIAHNPSSFTALASTLEKYFPTRKIILIFAVSKDKDIKKMLNKIKFKKIILTSFSNPRSLHPDKIARVAGLKEPIVTGEPREALKVALRLYNRDSLILVSGSLFLVAEVKKLLL